ncbi:MAG TPA: hypothetical protein VGF45_16560, partial [Polyangia bacterium]
ELLRGGVAVGGAFGSAATSACAHRPVIASPLPDRAMVEQLTRSLDRRMTEIENARAFPPGLGVPTRGPGSPAQLADLEARGKLLRKSMRTLYLTGRFIDLPDEIKTHPSLQDRVLAAQPEMDEAILGATAMLESLRPEQLRAIQQTLQGDPGLGERLAVVLDETGKADGIPFPRRMSTRAMTLQLAAQMAAQPPSLTIDPYVKRVRKITVRPHAADESVRLQVARVGERVFWEHQAKLAHLQARWQQELGGPSDPRAAAQAEPSRGRRVLSTGGRIMGFGVGSIGVGVVFAGIAKAGVDAAIWPALFFGVTLGPILVIVASLVLLAGLAIRAGE